MWYTNSMNERKKQATQLRKKGYSYGMINEELGISKSTLSCWFRDMPFTPNKKVIERIKQGPFKSGQLRHNQRISSIIKIKKAAQIELGEISKRDLWMLGIGLYIGEGSKAYEIIRISNSDPVVVKLAIEWFKDSCGLADENIIITLHLYPDNDKQKCVKYWSETIGVSAKKFRKTQVDERINKSNKKSRKLPYGTAHISIVSNGNPDFGVNLHRRIMGWIAGAMKY